MMIGVIIGQKLQERIKIQKFQGYDDKLHQNTRDERFDLTLCYLLQIHDTKIIYTDDKFELC